MIARCIIDELHDEPAINMALDEVLLEKVENAEEATIYLRFFKWSRPYCSFGYAQRVKNKTNLQARYELVRRPTGGGLVFHGHDTCISIVSSLDIHAKFSELSLSYNFLHSLILKGLFGKKNESRFKDEKLSLYLEKSEANLGQGVYSCFKKPVLADIMWGSEKVVGSAQKRIKKSFLQQGSIALDDLNIKEIIESFEDGLALKFKMYKYCQGDCDKASGLLDHKYLNPEWTLRI
ncbi:MAG: lipoate--protein ligase family protein [bacterium]|nr:lipoate--protein ligase family protein [bacterium]